MGQSKVPPLVIPAGISTACPHPSQNAVGTVSLIGRIDIPSEKLRQPEQALDLAPVEAHHRLPINNGDRGRPEAELQEFLESCGVRSNVLVHE